MKYIETLYDKQKKFFTSDATKQVSYRKAYLTKLLHNIDLYEAEIVKALKVDLNKSEQESYISEILLVRNEIKIMLKNIHRWSKTQNVRRNKMIVLSKSQILQEPYGVVLICAPWNYPFQLTLTPLIDAIAAGNTVIVYVSPYVPNTNIVLKKIINLTFPTNYVEVVDIKQSSYSDIMIPNYDYVFFTGSTRVGKIIATQLAERIIPITLELGGKSPCIVDETANLDIAAKRIIRGKLMNSGQTCIAPDYFLVHASIKDQLIEKLIHYIEVFYGKNIVQNQSIPKIINKLHFERLVRAIHGHHIIFGGHYDAKTLIFEPTIIDIKRLDSQIMSEEIFGPLLPIITFNHINEILAKYKPQFKPLALYIFSNNKSNIHTYLSQIQSGGCCINDTIMHVTNPNLPFGGIGNSGIGSYHGLYGFKTFSHYRALIKTSQLIDPKMFYPPWTKNKFKIIKKII